MKLRLHPSLQQVAALMPGGQFARMAADGLPGAREQERAAVAAVPLASSNRVDTENRLISRIDGRSAIPIRIYRPRKYDPPLPAMVYIHGGAFCLGSIDSEHLRALQLSADVPMMVVSVDYRLAPEYPFPAGLHDCFLVLNWMVNSAQSLGIDPQRVAVGGASAGGCLAAAAALMARDRGGPAIALQFLIYPALDDRLLTWSMTNFTNVPVINRADCARMWEFYLGTASKNVPPYAAPGRATDMLGLPPTYVMTAEYDPLRDEAIEFGSRLLHAGISVELHNVMGMVHGFDWFAEGLGMTVTKWHIEALRRALCTPSAKEA